MVKVPYNYADIAESINAIDESILHEAISCHLNNKHIDNKEYRLCGDYNLVYNAAEVSSQQYLNIGDRIQLYINTVCNCMSSVADVIASISKDKENNRMTYALKSFYETKMTQMQMMADSGRSSIQSTYSILTSFFKNSVKKNNILQPETATAKSYISVDVALSAALNDMMSYADITNPSVILDYAPETLIQLNDVLIDIDNFVQFLDQAKTMLVQIQLNTVNTISEISCACQYPTTNKCGYHNSAQRTYLTFGTYVKTAERNDQQILLNNSDGISRSDELSVVNLMYLKSSSPQISWDEPYLNTNGVFQQQIEIKDDSESFYDEVTAKYREDYNLAPGNVISRKNILNAIDYIFNYWTQHMKYFNVNVQICHNNCHTNAVKLTEFKSKSKNASMENDKTKFKTRTVL